MTVLLVILMFAVFFTADYLLSRRHVAVGGQASETTTSFGFEPARVPATFGLDPAPVWVSGYQLPADLQYHRGHTWARALNAETAVVGIDDFARRLVGKIKSVQLPKVGQKVRQGARTTTIAATAGERAAALLSPLDGEVLEINPRLAEQPELATEEPYGRGWLYKVRTRNLADNLNNLMSGSLARRWTEDSTLR